MSNEKSSLKDGVEPRVTVFRVTENGVVRHGRSASIYGFPHMGKLCRDYLRREKEVDEMTFDESLSSISIYDEDYVESVKQFGLQADLRAVLDINLDEQLFSVLERNGDWTVFPLKAVTVAAHHAYNDIYRPPERTIALFHEHIVGKDLQLPPEETSHLPGFGM